ncbi:MAG: SMC-Scp complex subunit ScpB [Patescibacteria group bacterium]|jgi:segregation and condensation protein B|nr:SMC-Scp complex subunit ScpB [Patescibacteria group bacterium]MDD5172959.1 SMC-Scp complex subunit ScpB [Patescibacteria group bacterium]
MEIKKIKSIIESILFIINRPLNKKELAKITEQKLESVEQALKELTEEHNSAERGIRIIQNGQDFQMVTSPENSQIIQNFLKQEINQELTPASLETLAIIAYRGPIRKEELEQIRGVNCSIILRNLLIKGLIVEEPLSSRLIGGQAADEDNEDKESQVYSVSLDFIRHLGINDLKELPDYNKLNKDVSLLSLAEQEE